ncbi:4415_t:CDS:2, partial [Racocetra fulgida]
TTPYRVVFGQFAHSDTNIVKFLKNDNDNDSFEDDNHHDSFEDDNHHDTFEEDNNYHDSFEENSDHHEENNNHHDLFEENSDHHEENNNHHDLFEENSNYDNCYDSFKEKNNHCNSFENELDPHYFLPESDPDNFSEEESYNSLDFSEHISERVIVISDSEVETTHTTYEKEKWR